MLRIWWSRWESQGKGKGEIITARNVVSPKGTCKEPSAEAVATILRSVWLDKNTPTLAKSRARIQETRQLAVQELSSRALRFTLGRFWPRKPTVIRKSGSSSSLFSWHRCARYRQRLRPSAREEVTLFEGSPGGQRLPGYPQMSSANPS